MRRDFVCAGLLAILVGHFALSYAAQRWWSLGFHSCATTITNCSDCAQTNAATNVFNPQQERLCSSSGGTDMVWSISKGVLSAIRMCQAKFTNTQWNCTTFNGRYLFGRFVENCTPEQAILKALLCAGTARQIASTCHKGRLDGCKCVSEDAYREDDKTYLFSCNDNVIFACDFIKDFCINRSSCVEKDLVNKWNCELGLKCIMNTSRFCRCTGLSGSCVVQTCYQRAPAMEEIGCKLRAMYDSCQKVRGSNCSLHLYGHPDRTPINTLPVYINDTPDLCSPSLENGILGTRGRVCDPTSTGSDSCNTLCCNGFEQVEYLVPRESCRFVWCCRIECTDLEPERVTEYRCL